LASRTHGKILGKSKRESTLHLRLANKREDLRDSFWLLPTPLVRLAVGLSFVKIPLPAKNHHFALAPLSPKIQAAGVIFTGGSRGNGGFGTRC
jgi:hypothetical protein